MNKGGISYDRQCLISWLQSLCRTFSIFIRHGNQTYFVQNLDTRAYLATRWPMQCSERGLGRYVMRSSSLLYFVCLIRNIDSFGRQDVAVWYTAGADMTVFLVKVMVAWMRVGSSCCAKVRVLTGGQASVCSYCLLFLILRFSSNMEARTPYVHQPRRFPSDVRCTVFIFLACLITV